MYIIYGTWRRQTSPHNIQLQMCGANLEQMGTRIFINSKISIIVPNLTVNFAL